MRRDGQARKEAILDAAMRCFVRGGVVGTGVEEIRKEAQASPSSLYHLFAGREDILRALLSRIFERSFTEVAARVTRTRSAKGLVRALVRGHIEWVVHHPDEARAMYQTLSLELTPDFAEQLGAHKAQLLAPIVEHASPFIERGELPPWPPTVFDVVLLGAAHEACRRWLSGGDPEPQWMLEVLPAIAWRSLGNLRSLWPNPPFDSELGWESSSSESSYYDLGHHARAENRATLPVRPRAPASEPR